MMPSLSAYPEMTWEPILLCDRKGKLGAGEPWQGERVGRGIGVLGVKLVMMKLWRFSGVGLLRKPRQLLIV